MTVNVVSLGDGWRERLHDLLGALGNSQITVDQFWRYMREAGLDDDDIRAYFREDHHNDGNRGSEPGRDMTSLDKDVIDLVNYQYGVDLAMQGIGLRELSSDWPRAFINKNVRRGYFDTWRRRNRDPNF